MLTRLGACQGLCANDVDDPSADKPEDWVIATGKTTTVEILSKCLRKWGLNWSFMAKVLMK